MDIALFAVATNYLWYAFPLVIVVSLVYAATRHERMIPILAHAVRLGVWIAGFMGVIFLLVTLVCWMAQG